MKCCLLCMTWHSTHGLRAAGAPTLDLRKDKPVKIPTTDQRGAHEAPLLLEELLVISRESGFFRDVGTGRLSVRAMDGPILICM